MGRACSVCQHPRRGEIDKALVSGTPYRDISGRFDVSKSAVERHRAEHVPEALEKAKVTEDARQAIDVVRQLKTINQLCIEAVSNARLAGDSRTVLMAVDRIHRQIELQAKLLGDLDERTQVNVLLDHPQWIETRTVIVDTLQPYPEALRAVVDGLKALKGGDDGP